MIQRPRPITARRPTAGSGRLVLFAMCSSVIVVFAGMTSLGMALPDIGRHLRADQSELQWMADGYALVLAAFVLPCGALGDRFGRKWSMLLGMMVLFGALLIAAGAGSAWLLIAARCLGGLGAALVFPGTLATVTAVYPPERRGRAVGLWSASAIFGGLVGLLASGILIGVFWWGSIFLAGAITALGAFALIAVVVPNTSDPNHVELDPGGAVLAVAAVGGLVLWVTEGPLRGWSDGLTLAALMLGAGALAGFVAWELRAAHPLLDVRLFTDRGFAAGALSVSVQLFCALGVLFLSIQYLAYVLGYGPLGSGFVILSLGMLMLPAAVIADPMARRFGRARVGGFGLAAMVPGFVILALMTTASSSWQLALGLAVLGGGLGIAMVPATEAIVEALPPAKQGVASAVNDVAREFGGALGIAALGSVLNGTYRAQIADAGSLPAELTRIARDSPAAGLDVAASLGVQGRSLVDLVRGSFMHGWTEAMIVAAVAAGIGALVVAVRTPKRSVDLRGTVGDPIFVPRTAVARGTGGGSAATRTD